MRRAVGMALIGGPVEIFGVMVLAGEEARVAEALLGGERDCKSHPPLAPVGIACLPLEMEWLEGGQPMGRESGNIEIGVATFQGQHRQSLAAREKIADERGEREALQGRRRNQSGIGDCKQLQKGALELSQ